jgi:sortase (surface protein transpeptidase)
MINAPLNFSEVGWSIESAKVGSKGTVILDGHVDNREGPAVFYNLRYAKVNQKVFVSSSTGEQLRYRVVCVESYDRLKAPMDKIFKDDQRSRLNMITCYGTYDKKLGTYDRRLVVYCLID